MKRNPEATCSSCPFYNPNKFDPISGHCQAAPMVYTPSQEEPWLFSWPPTLPEEWCGLHPDFLTPEPIEAGPYLARPHRGGLRPLAGEGSD